MINTDSASTVKPDIDDVSESVYRDIVNLLDKIIEQMTGWEVSNA